MYLGLEIAGGWITLDVLILLCWALAARHLSGGHE